MPDNQSLFHKYEQLLPTKLEGGMLIFVLHEKIKSGELDSNFSSADIKATLMEISTKYHLEVPRVERILKPLLNYYLRNLPDQPGQYYLTDFAEGMVELIWRKLENPYKSLKLKESFEKYFSIRHHNILSADDMERTFGREFIEGHKNIIRHHLDSLEDEMQDAYRQLRDILHADEKDATQMVSDFALTFKKFGERAEDINHAIAEKDRFLKDLRYIVDGFYNSYTSLPIPLSESEKLLTEEMAFCWRRSSEIYGQVELFFLSVDVKLAHINRQIYYASGKLTELQENFSTRAKMKLAIKLMLKLSLDYAIANGEEIFFDPRFPKKRLVQEPLRFLSPGHHEFMPTERSLVVEQEDDPEYSREATDEIHLEMDREEKINLWVETAKETLKKHPITLDGLMEEIMAAENDLLVAYRVAAEITAFAGDESDFNVSVEPTLIALEKEDLFLWKTKLQHQKDMDF